MALPGERKCKEQKPLSVGQAHRVLSGSCDPRTVLDLLHLGFDLGHLNEFPIISIL